MTNITENNLNELCRICMKTINNASSQSKIKNSSDQHQTLEDIPKTKKSNESITIPILELLYMVQPKFMPELEDELPNVICMECVDDLVITYKFLRTYQESDAKFRQFLKQSMPVNSMFVEEINDGELLHFSIEKIEEPFIVDANEIDISQGTENFSEEFIVPCSASRVSIESDLLSARKRKLNSGLCKLNKRARQMESDEQYVSIQSKETTGKDLSPHGSQMRQNVSAEGLANLKTEEVSQVKKSFEQKTEGTTATNEQQQISIIQPESSLNLNKVSNNKCKTAVSRKSFKNKPMKVLQNADILSENGKSIDSVCLDTISVLPRKQNKTSELKRNRKVKPRIESLKNKKVIDKALPPQFDSSPCCNNCPYKCVNIFTAEERRNIFKSFWSLTAEEKRHFYLKYVSKGQVKHRSKNTTERKQFSFKYHFKKNQTVHRVCREFFLNTININQKRIYYCFESLTGDECSLVQKRIKQNDFEKLETEKENNGQKAKHDVKHPKEFLELCQQSSLCQPINFIPPKSNKKLLESNPYRKKYKTSSHRNVCKKVLKNESKEVVKKEDISIEIEEFILPEFALNISKENVPKKPNKTAEMNKHMQMKRKLETAKNNKVIDKALPPQFDNSLGCNNCHYNCLNIFTAEDRRNIFQSFWSLTNHEQTNFYLKFVIKDKVKRRRIINTSDRKQFTFKYHFEKNQSVHRVCREFFTSTINVNQKRIYYCFATLNKKTRSKAQRKIAKKAKCHTVQNKLLEVCEQISSCQTIKSTCSSSKSNKKLLESNPYIIEKYKPPASVNIYRKVFKTKTREVLKKEDIHCQDEEFILPCA